MNKIESINENSNKFAENERKEVISQTLLQLLKNHLSNEMFDACFIIIETPHLVLKLFLVLFLIVSHALNAFITIQLILTYLQYDVTTTSRIINETPVEFPQVTFCNLNPFTTQQGWNVVKQFYSDEMFTNLSLYTRQTYGFQLKNLALNILSTDVDKKSIGHSLEDILIGCKFNAKECFPSDFQWNFDTNYGNCYRFNTGFNSSGHKIDSRTSSLAGSLYGLQLDLYVNNYENLTLFNSATESMGVLIRIDNTTNVIDYGLDGIRTSAGSYTNLALGREFKFQMKQPYSDCILDNDVVTRFNSDIYTAILKSKYSYSQQFCFIQCFQRLVIEKCNCYTSMHSSVFNASKCSTLDCVLDTYFNIYSVNDYVNKNCLPLCPLECNSTRFTYTTSISKLLGNTYIDLIKKNPNLAEDFVTQQIDVRTARGSIVKTNIFYDTLSYVIIQETPSLDLVTLVSNMGGSWGLFLSVNLFTIAQIVAALIEILYSKREVKK